MTVKLELELCIILQLSVIQQHTLLDSTKPPLDYPVRATLLRFHSNLVHWRVLVRKLLTAWLSAPLPKAKDSFFRSVGN
jgi:hypothetical protein